jgi:hypothetical protein
MTADGHSSGGAWNTASREEKHDMQPVSAAPHYAQQQPPQGQYPAQPTQYNSGFNAAEAPGARY